MADHSGRTPANHASGHATLQAVRGYWEALRPAGAIPARAAVDPRGLADSLDRVFLIERIGRGQARFRLAGRHLADLMGMDLRGMPLSALFTPPARDRLAAEVEPVLTASAVLHLTLEGEGGFARRALQGQMLLLPLRGEADEPGLALGCLVTQGPLTRAPRRLAIAASRTERLLLPRLQLVAETAVKPARTPATRPALRLVSSLE